MIVYFACSITGGRDDAAIYKVLVAAMQADGHTVPTAILASDEVDELEPIADPFDIYSRDTAWIRGADRLVAEVTTPSHGVGYEIGYALGLKKQVLCLHQAGRKVSKMITGNPDPHLTVREYETTKEAVAILRNFLS